MPGLGAIDKAIARHAYNLVAAWYREGHPNALKRYHWIRLRNAVERKQENKNKRKVRSP